MIETDTVQHSPAEGADPRRWFALAAIAAAQFMVVLDIAIVNVALPAIQKDLHFSPENLQWVITAYAIVFGGFLLLGGRLADLLGRRRVFVFGLSLFTVASLFNGLAWSSGSLIAFRALQGLGGALLSPAALSILTTSFPEGRERNVALGVWGAVAGSGAAAGTLLGGVLTSALSWSWIFFVNVPLGVLLVALTPWLLKESRADLAARRFDFAGAVSVTAGLMLLVYAMTEATRVGWAASRTVAFLAVSAVLLIGFVVIELRSESPVMPLRIFRLRTLRGANIVGFLLGTALFSQFFLLSLYMQQVLHYSALRTGVAYVATTFTVIVFSGVAQGLVTKFGVRTILAWGLALATISLAAYTRLPADGSYVANLLPWFLIGGVGLGLSFVPMSIGALTGVAPREAGVASGLINTTTQIGGAIGLAVTTTIATTVSTHYLASHPGLTPIDPSVITAGFHVAFVVLAFVAVIAAVAAIVLVRSAEEEESVAPVALPS